MVTDHKEKFGTVRVYCGFGYYHNYFPYWLNALVIPYQQLIYKLAYRKAIQKWPRLREEILYGADHSELLEFLGIKHVRESAYGSTMYVEYHPKNWSVRYPPELKPTYTRRHSDDPFRTLLRWEEWSVEEQWPLPDPSSGSGTWDLIEYSGRAPTLQMEVPDECDSKQE